MWRSGLGRERASEYGGDVARLRGERVAVDGGMRGRGSREQSTATASSPKRTGAAIAWTSHGAPLSLSMEAVA